MVPHLVALTDGPNIPLSKPIMLIGRHQECDIQIPSRKISRRHCCIAQVAKHLVVRDLGSTNGIRINGTRSVEGKLEVGDELTIGNMRYEVRWLEAGAVAEAAAVPATPSVERDSLESCDQPLALSEREQDRPLRAIPVAPEPPKVTSNNNDDLGSLFPEAIKLMPLDSKAP
jgi:predicted component of type VI protein secretion system